MVDAAPAEADAAPGQPDAAAEGPDAAVGPITGDGKFRPMANGFAFENYTNEGNPTNLTVDDLRAMFGDGVCASMAGGTCTLTPPGDKWMAETNAAMNGGHCEGFAVMSLLFFAHTLKADDYGAAAVHDLAFMSNTALQRGLAYWWATQVLERVQQTFVADLTPRQVADKLGTTLADPNAPEAYTLAIYKSNWEGGHAITPYSVVDLGGGTERIMVYDNNFPNEERAIEIDRNADTWKYFAATNPSEPGALYNGDASTKNLILRPISPRLGKQPCPFCMPSPLAITGAAALPAMRQISLLGDADLLVTDDQGRRIGHVAGTLIDEIPNAQTLKLTAVDVWNGDLEPTYFLPAGRK
jgi:hypothetical protein